MSTPILVVLILMPSVVGAAPWTVREPVDATAIAGVDPVEQPTSPSGNGGTPPGAEPVPEPGTLMLTGIGLVGLGLVLASRRRRTAPA